MKKKIEQKDKGLQRKSRIRYKVKQNLERPRLCVFRSNKYIYGQIVDNASGDTLVGLSSKDVKPEEKDKGKIDISFRTGLVLAQKAKEKNIESIVFDRSGYKYHGRVKALAEGARQGGLKF